MTIFDNYGRAIGTHDCADNRHLCLVATKRTKENAQRVAFTIDHPAHCAYVQLASHLTETENAWVDAQIPGNGLIA